MDIQKKLKFIFWVLVLGLWGFFAWGFLKKGKLSRIVKIENPFGDIKISEILPRSLPATETVSDGETLPEIPIMEHTAPAVETSDRILIETPDTEISFPTRSKKTDTITDYHTTEERREIAKKPKGEKRLWASPPDGYAVEDTKGFLIYKELPPILKTLIENLHYLRGNLMLDLVVFSPWTRHNKVLLYLFDNKTTYHKFTKRPLWSDGVSDLINRTIYVINGTNAPGILAHELSHIYFDSFFDVSVPSPLWLSEGVAVFMQTERGKQTPHWLKENLRHLENGGGIKLENLMSCQNLNGLPAAAVQLWYAQSYSVVRFLMKFKNLDTFYQFCKNLRDGSSIGGGLYRAYGLPFNKISSLEYAWRYDLKTKKITGID